MQMVRAIFLKCTGENHLGLIFSIGGLSERLVNNSSKNMLAEISHMEKAQLETFTTSLLAVFKRHQKQKVGSRVSKSASHFSSNMANCLSSSPKPFLEDKSSQYSFKLFSPEITKSRVPNKIMTNGDVFCQLFQVADTKIVKKCLVQLSIFLCHNSIQFQGYREASGVVGDFLPSI